MIRGVYGPNEPLEGELAAAAMIHQGGQLRVLVAWARDEGAWRLLRAVGNYIPTIEVLVGGNEIGTTAEAMLRLKGSCQRLGFFFKHPNQTFHPKVYCFSGGDAGADTVTFMIGSSNLTRGGLVTNFEASAVIGPGCDHGLIYDRFETEWLALWSEPFTTEITDEACVTQLWRAGYVTTEQELVRRRLKERSSARKNQGVGSAPTRPTAPPKWVPRPGFIPTPLPFIPQSPTAGEGGPLVAPVDPDLFYVRTLTINDVHKLQKLQTGTFEPDLGITARDLFPDFWGWPNRYQLVNHRGVPRDEWPAAGRLRSTVRPNGVVIKVVLWHRAARPGHPQEHRISLQPIPVVRDGSPPTFTTESLLLVERSGSQAYDYELRFITEDEHDYPAYASYLTEQASHHRYGYGP